MKDQNNVLLKVGSKIRSIQSAKGAGICECIAIQNNVATFWDGRKELRLDSKNFYNSDWRIEQE